MYIFTVQSTAMINLNTSYGTLSCDKVPEGVGILGQAQWVNLGKIT